MALKSKELEPTRENLLQTLEQNMLDRNKSVWQFARFCDAQTGKCAIAIDAKWGYGKTFFVRHVQILLEAFNIFTDAVTDEERTAIKKAFQRQIGTGDNEIALEPQVCVYYDAWKNDNDGDPILSLVYEILRSTAQNFPFKKSVDCIEVASLIADFFTGKNSSDFVKLIKEKDPLSELKVQKEIHSLVSQFLDSLLYEQGKRLLVIVDELDRCKPEYAVRLLERIKHYFSNDRITFVFSLNLEELQHTVKCFYGEGFDACRYLDRFFDYRITLPPANMENYYRMIGLENGSWVYESVCKAVIDYCDFGLREIEKYYRMAKIAAFNPTHNNSYYGFSDGNGLQFSLSIILPIIIGLRMKDFDLYNQFVTGENVEPLIDIMGDGTIANAFCNGLLERGETYDKRFREDEEKKLVRLEDKLTEVYQALFVGNNRTPWDEIHIGEYSFSKQTKEKIMRAASMLSEYASYE